MKYIITSAVPGASVNTKFLASIRTYCKENNASLIVIPTAPIVMSDEGIFDPRIPEECFLASEQKFLNTNFRIFNIPISPQQVDPVTSLQRNGQTYGSFCLGSPKQRLKFVVNSNSDLPRAIMSTGAVTNPDNYRFNRQGFIARVDHVLGALVVEIKDSKRYSFRQVQASKDGSFVDDKVRYYPDGKTSIERPLAVVFGDWHTKNVDPIVRERSIEIIDHYKPDEIIFHDILDFESQNHHNKGKNIRNAQLGDFCNVKNELDQVAEELEFFSKKAGKRVFVVRSNHDEALDRWLESGDYVSDNRNFEIGHELALAKLRGNNPLEWYVKHHKKVKAKNIIFLDRDEDLKLSDKKIQCGAHGDLGGNGARGSTASTELSYGKSISGHSHTPEIQRGAFVVGTSTKLKLNYNRGPSSWVHAHCVLYKDGSRQLINIINGEWRFDEQGKSEKSRNKGSRGLHEVSGKTEQKTKRRKQQAAKRASKKRKY
jgi:hypothetical protein